MVTSLNTTGVVALRVNARNDAPPLMIELRAVVPWTVVELETVIVDVRAMVWGVANTVESKFTEFPAAAFAWTMQYRRSPALVPFAVPAAPPVSVVRLTVYTVGTVRSSSAVTHSRVRALRATRA